MRAALIEPAIASLDALPGRATGEVRPFVEKDIPQVAELHRRVFRTSVQPGLEVQRSYRSYFSEIFLNHPWRDLSLPSLVYQEKSGKIVGFLGVMPRRLLMLGKPIQSAVSSQFVVEPEQRSVLVGLQLLRTFLSGSQDLSIADEANDAARQLWQAFGGTTAWLPSIHWQRLLRPTQLVQSFLRSRAKLKPLALASAPFCGLADALAVRWPHSPFRQSASPLAAEELKEETLLGCIVEFSRGSALRPDYDPASVKWLLNVLSKKKTHGLFQKILLRSPRGEIVGWYLGYFSRGGVGEVMQIEARPRWAGKVLDHLFYHAWRYGAVALGGRLDPRLMQALRDRYCLFHNRGPWVLVHSKSPELLNAIHRGDAFLTRTEGEWCMRFD